MTRYSMPFLGEYYGELWEYMALLYGNLFIVSRMIF